jgi:TonB family protein
MSVPLGPDWLDWIHAIGWTLLHFLWQGALVGAAYGLVRWLASGAGPQVRYAIGLVALALLAALPAVTLYGLAPHTTFLSAALNVATDAPLLLPDRSLVATSVGAGIEPWLPWLVGAWMVGVLAFSLRALAQYLSLRRLCRLEAQAVPEWDAKVAELCRRFGVTRPVRLLRSAIVQTPSLFGWIAPVILMPAGMLVGLSPHQIELVIAHELGHIRRWDYAVNLLQIAIETVLFFHPVVHWISRDVRNEREACCDDLVLRLGADPVDYASTLARLEELRDVTHAPALAASGGALIGRIRRIVGAEPMFAAPRSGAQGGLLVVLAFAALLGVQPVSQKLLDRGVDLPKLPAFATPVTLPSQLLAGAASRAVDNVAMSLQRTTPTLVAPEAAAPPAPHVELTSDVRVPAPSAPRLDVEAERPALAFAPVDLELPATAPRAPTVVVSEPKLPVPLKIVQPTYPRRAMTKGIEGTVTLSFTIDADGVPREIRVEHDAVPGEYFDSAAEYALERWRFDPARVIRGQRYTQNFAFAVSPNRKAVEAGCRVAVGSRICRPLDNVQAAPP